MFGAGRTMGANSDVSPTPVLSKAGGPPGPCAITGDVLPATASTRPRARVRACMKDFLEVDDIRARKAPHSHTRTAERVSSGHPVLSSRGAEEDEGSTLLTLVASHEERRQDPSLPLGMTSDCRSG